MIYLEFKEVLSKELMQFGKNIEIEDEIISPVPDAFTIGGKDFIEKSLIHDLVKVADKKQCVLCKEKKTEKRLVIFANNAMFHYVQLVVVFITKK